MLMDMFHEVAGGKHSRRVHFHAFMQGVQSDLHDARQKGAQDAARGGHFGPGVTEHHRDGTDNVGDGAIFGAKTIFKFYGAKQ